MYVRYAGEVYMDLGMNLGGRGKWVEADRTDWFCCV